MDRKASHGECAIGNISTTRPHLCGVGAVHHENAIAKTLGEPIVRGQNGRAGDVCLVPAEMS